MENKCIDYYGICDYCPFNYHCKDKKLRDYLAKKENIKIKKFTNKGK